MPFYEYQCRACGAHTEVLQKISDAPLRKCPECGKNQLTKLVSAPVFRLKGGGWYETDFKSDSENKRNLVGEKDKEAAPAKAEDAKPDPTGGKSEATADKPAGESKSAGGESGKPAAAKASPRKPAARAGAAKKRAAPAKKPAARSRR